jgi:ankyrin repeat protein
MSGRDIQHYATRRLPPQPNLEQLRKQAKDLLDAYRAGDPAAVAEVRQFEREPDATSFALNDAQRVLARAYGYASWTKLKAFIDGVNVGQLAEAVKTGDMAQVRSLLNSRPELVGIDMGASNEHRALHYAVLRRDSAMVRLLMEAGADAHQGIYPHRDATSALAIAREREYHEVAAVIEEEERLRRAELSCPNATISPLQDQIELAISQADNARAIALLEADGSLIHACDREGATPLHTAAEEANEEMLEWLLERRAFAKKRNIRELTPLDVAALAADPRNDKAKSFPAVARRLLKYGAELTIHAAVALGDARRVRELIDADASVLRRSGRNGGLLTLAVNHGKIDMVRLLLDFGADVDERVMLEELEEPTPSWGMPLWYAALANEHAIAELLLDRGADPNANVYASGWPLRNAWGHADGAIKKLLLARGAKRQPYMVAEEHDVAEAKRLLEADTSEDLAQELAWSGADHGCAAIVELALARLAWPRDDPRWHWVIIQPIRGASGDDRENEGNFASMAALLRHGIDPNVSRYGQTALHFAAGYRGAVSDRNRARFAAMLLEGGADPGRRDDLLKSTPLGWACRWGRKDLVETLIARGARTVELDAEPWATPRAWAQKMKQDAILPLLSR